MKTSLIASLVLLTACSSHLGVSNQDVSRLQVMNQAVTVDSSGVSTNSLSSIGSSNDGTVHAQDLLCSLLCFTPSLTMIGSIAPPVVNSQSLQASDVTLSGTKAYVAYNLAGVNQAGGVDVIDVSTPGTPILKSSTTYSDMDINKVFVDGTNSQLYLAGNTSSGATGALLKRIELDSSGLPTTAVESKVLRSAADSTIPAYAATSVLKSGNYVFATSGSNGGLSILNASDLSDAAFTAIPDARDLGVGNSSNILVVAGQTASSAAQVNSYSAATGALQSSVLSTLFSGSVNEQGKSSLFTSSTGYIATGGQGGTKFICNDGTSIGSLLSPILSGLTSSETAANAVTFGNGIIYVAQGGAGVYMYAVQNSLLGLGGCAALTISYVGKFTLGARASANNVYYSSGYLIVATGAGGFQIIQVTQGLVSGLLQNL